MRYDENFQNNFTLHTKTLQINFPKIIQQKYRDFSDISSWYLEEKKLFFKGFMYEQDVTQGQFLSGF